jgi:F1F0 ATPase subunit 2
MNETASLAACLAAGMLLGALFFGGLWWTVRLGLASQRSALWFICSLLARTSVALSGFYFIGRESWQRWLLCLVGFILARSLVKHGSRTRQRSYAP